ncbi:hypothetical protein C8_417 [Cannes 8 virus]|nr:hypothetical protein C8_417 [Cannes 8 virus]
MSFGRFFERNPLYVEENIVGSTDTDDEMPSLLTPEEVEYETEQEEEILQGEALNEIREQVFGGYDHDGAYNVLCPCCDAYRGQKNVVVLVKGKTSSSTENFKEFSKFEGNIWF